jgi:hypothetical protein
MSWPAERAPIGMPVFVCWRRQMRNVEGGGGGKKNVSNTNEEEWEEEEEESTRQKNIISLAVSCNNNNISYSIQLQENNDSNYHPNDTNAE